MSNEEIIGNVLGAVVAIKVLDTGMKIVDKKSKKIKLDESSLKVSKKKAKWY